MRARIVTSNFPIYIIFSCFFHSILLSVCLSVLVLSAVGAIKLRGNTFSTFLYFFLVYLFYYRMLAIKCVL